MENESRSLGFEPKDPAPPSQPTGCLGAFLTFLLILGLGLAIVVPNMRKAGNQGNMTRCKSNCKNLATALEMYASDNKGLYPLSLGQLIPGNYLKAIPTCPDANRDTYTDSYQWSASPDAFSFCCKGKNHASAYSGFRGDSANFPKYSSAAGLIDHPSE